MLKTKICVIENDLSTANALLQSLSDLGYTATRILLGADSLVDTLNLLHPGLIILSATSLDKVAQIRESCAVPIVFITDTDALPHLKMAEPEADYVLKPFTTRELQLSLDFALYRAQVHSREAQMHVTLTYGPALSWTTDRALLITAVTGRIMPQLGGSAERFVGHPLSEFISEDEAQSVIDAHKCAMIGEATSFNVSIDGLLFTCYVEPLRDQGERVIGCVGYALDVTKQRQSEGNLRQQTRYMTTLHEIALSLISDLNTPTTLRILVERAVELAETRHGFINVIDPEKQTMQVAVALGKYSSRANKVYSTTEGAVGEALASGQSLITRNYGDYQHKLNDLNWLYTAVSIPLKLGNTVIGVLGVGYEMQVEISPDLMNSLNRLAELAALVLHNAQLYEAAQHEILERKRTEEARRTSELLERQQREIAESLRNTAAALTTAIDLDTIVSRLIENIGRILHYDVAGILLRQDNFYNISYTFGVSDDFSARLKAIRNIDLTQFAQQAQQIGGAWLIEDLERISNSSELLDTLQRDGLRCVICAPIRVRGEIIGLLNLNSRVPRRYTQTELEHLTAFADLAGVAIENARIYDKLKQHTVELQQHVFERTKELARERAQLQSILDGINEAVMYIDSTTGTIVYVNHVLELMIGSPSDQIVGKPFWIMNDWFGIEHYDRMTTEVRNVLKDDKIWYRELSIKIPREFGGLDVGVSISQIKTPDGERMGAIMLMRDIGQEKALRAQKDQFIASAAHELRTPITSLVLRLYLMRNQPENMDIHLSKLETGINYVVRLVEDMLDVSRFERGVIKLLPTDTDILWLVKSILEDTQQLATAKHIDLQADLPDKALTGIIDPVRIRQVISNLIDNALKYTPPHGQVRVSLETQEIQHDLYAVIRIQDSGIGIPSEALPYVFDPFFRADPYHEPGTGLGLVIVKEIVNRHDGWIDVESIRGEGSCFTVFLPIDTKFS
jgi:PAS domain S-box-containing protein